MVITPDKYVCFKCYNCGEFVFGSFSIFEVINGKQKDFTCSCKKSMLTVKKHNKEYDLAFPCFICNEIHSLKLPFKSLWGKDSILLYCTISDVGVCSIGDFKSVSNWAKEFEKLLESYYNEYELEVFFANKDVMYQIIDNINKMSFNGEISCECGYNEIEIELTHDMVVLTCLRCGAVKQILAKTENDLSFFENNDQIVIGNIKKRDYCKIIEFKRK